MHAASKPVLNGTLLKMHVAIKNVLSDTQLKMHVAQKNVRSDIPMRVHVVKDCTLIHTTGLSQDTSNYTRSGGERLNGDDTTHSSPFANSGILINPAAIAGRCG